MGQVSATFTKTFKELLREKSVLFWTIAWPIIWVMIISFSFTKGVPESHIPSVRGAITISMITFAITIAGMANLPGNIASDRERGLLVKLKSMPVSASKDFAGRIIGLLTFSCLAGFLVLISGFVCGARFSGKLVSIIQSLGFLAIVFLASAGIGLIVGSLIKHVHGAIMTGVAISVITSSISGIFAPYYSLPEVLQTFSRFYPVSSANSSIIYLLVGEWYAGYNPLNFEQIVITLIVSALLFALGLTLYSKHCWR